MNEEESYQTYLKANRLITIDRYEEAAELLEPLVALPNAASYYYNKLITCYINLEQFSKAKKLLDVGLENFPNEEYFHAQLAYYYRLQNKLKKAIQSIKRALELDPHHNGFLYQLSEIYYSQNNLSQALHYAGLAEEEEPNDFSTIALKAMIHYERGNYKKASVEIDRALEIDPNDSTLLTLKSNIVSLDPKKRKEAEELAISSLQADPNDTFAKSSLLEILKNRNWLLRFFIGKSFNRYKLDWSPGRVILMIICWKGVLLWGGFALLYLLVTWYGGVLFNTFSRLSFKYKLLLSKNDIHQSNFFITLNIVLIGAILFLSLGQYEGELKFAVYTSLALLLLCGISYFEITRKSGKIAFFIFCALVILALFAALPSFFFCGVLGLLFLLLYAFLFTLKITFI